MPPCVRHAAKNDSHTCRRVGPLAYTGGKHPPLEGQSMDRFEELRAWAKGSYPVEAATELLIRAFEGRFAGAGYEWMQATEDGDLYIEFEAIPTNIGGLSGGEKRFLMLVSSLAGESLISLGDVLPGLDRELMHLVLAAVAHAAGTHEGSEFIEAPDGTVNFKRAVTLYAWPELPPRLRLVDGGPAAGK